MAEVADASGGAWRELDAHYVHQSRMIGMAVDIQAWPADSADYRSALGARLRTCHRPTRCNCSNSWT